MKTVFADTLYWIAISNPNDDWHKQAVKVSSGLVEARLITTDEVLVEVLTFVAKGGLHSRAAAVALVKDILGDPNITVVPQTRDSFLSGLNLYESRLDKDYSLTDCVSMEAMRKRELTEVLTHDHHFTQEGFTILL